MRGFVATRTGTSRGPTRAPTTWSCCPLGAAVCTRSNTRRRPSRRARRSARAGTRARAAPAAAAASRALCATPCASIVQLWRCTDIYCILYATHVHCIVSREPVDEVPVVVDELQEDAQCVVRVNKLYVRLCDLLVAGALSGGRRLNEHLRHVVRAADGRRRGRRSRRARLACGSARRRATRRTASGPLFADFAFAFAVDARHQSLRAARHARELSGRSAICRALERCCCRRLRLLLQHHKVLDEAFDVRVRLDAQRLHSVKAFISFASNPIRRDEFEVRALARADGERYVRERCCRVS